MKTVAYIVAVVVIAVALVYVFVNYDPSDDRTWHAHTAECAAPEGCVLDR